MQKQSRVAWIAFIFLALVTSYAQAGHPQYLIPRSAPQTIAPPTPLTSSAVGTYLDAQPYAYGYFGVQPRRHWTRHFGYYRTYTEWSAK